MASHEGTDPMEDFHTVFVETSLHTRLATLSHKHETISDFRDKFCMEHKQSFPEFGEISISALKVKRGGHFYRLPDCMNMSMAFEGIKTTNWFMNVDAARVENGEQLVAIMAAAAIDSVLVDEHDKNEIALDSKGLALETKVVEKKTRKRSSDGRESRKKRLLREFCGKVQVEVAMTESLGVLPRDKLDDILAGAIVKDNQSGEKNGVTMGENQQTSDADQELVDGHTKDEVKDVQANQTLKEALETDESQKSCGEVPSVKVDDLAGGIEQDLANGHITSRDDVTTESHEACAQVQVAAEHCDTLPREKLDDLLSGAKEKDIVGGEGSSLAPGAADNLETAELVTGQEDQLEAGNDFTTGPFTEKMSSKDDTNQSTPAAASTTSTKVVLTEINGVPGNEMDEKSVEDVGRDGIETVNPANQQEANNGLTTGPVSEKKKKRKKSSKDDMDQSPATTQQENEIGEKKRRKKKSSRKVVKGVAGNGDAAEFLAAFTEGGN